LIFTNGLILVDISLGYQVLTDTSIDPVGTCLDMLQKVFKGGV